jgi:uncharacterized protein (TIGR01244 family)
MFNKKMTSVFVTVLSLMLFGSLAEGQADRPPAGVANYTRIDATFACAGATPVEAIPDLKRGGFASIINFRMPDEQGANVEESKAMAAKVGLKYIHLPFRTPTTELADAFLKAVRDPANQPAFIHCGAANRAAAMWLIKRLEVDQWDEDRAVKEAEALGMRSANLKEFALDYAKKR